MFLWQVLVFPEIHSMSLLKSIQNNYIWQFYLYPEHTEPAWLDFFLKFPGVTIV